MDVLKTMKRSATFLGLGDKDKSSIRLLACIVVVVVVIANVIQFLINKWSDMYQRILALKALIFLFASFNYFLMLSLNWRDISPLLYLFHDATIRIPYDVSPRRKHLFAILEAKVRRINAYLSTMSASYVFASIPIPLIIVAVKVVLQSVDLQHVIKDPLNAPFPIYFPQYVKRFEKHEPLLNVIFYCVGYAMHSTCMIFMITCCLLVCVTTLSAFLNVEYELKLLALSLAEMDYMIGKPSHLHNAIDYSSLQQFCRYIIRHHQQTYSKFEVVSKGVRGIAFNFGFFNALYSCLSIFTIVKEDHIMLKFQELLYTSVWIFGIYLYDVSAERAKTEHDNLRNALYECSWQDKPEWFKKTILVIMARTCRPFDIKAFGIFGFGLNCFATRINAAYCYYNFLCNFN